MLKSDSYSCLSSSMPMCSQHSLSGPSPMSAYPASSASQIDQSVAVSGADVRVAQCSNLIYSSKHRAWLNGGWLVRVGISKRLRAIRWPSQAVLGDSMKAGCFFHSGDAEESQLEASRKRPGSTSGRRKHAFRRSAVAIFAMSPGADASK